jgi:Nif-specific regulatory protein
MKTKDELLRIKNAELTALLEVSKALGSSFELEKNLSHSMRILSDFLGMRRGTVTLLDPETKELKIVAAYGLSKEEIQRGKYRIGEGIVGRVVKTGFPMIIPNIGEEPMFLNRTLSRMNKDKISFLCVPVKFKGEILGVLSADRIFEEKVSLEEDLRVLKIVSSLIAQSIKLNQAYLEEKREKENLSFELKKKYSFPNIIGSSDKMQEVFKSVYKVAKSDITVILRGESGTGKELIAKAIHYESKRAKGPFIAINCAALPEGLLESELFGYEKGAFTGAISSKKGRFELADGGTIFLDEIGEISPAIQVKLLRVLQEHEFERLGGIKTIKVDVRLIAATNKDLEAAVKEGSFRDDLYWRLNVVPIFLPPIWERKEDIPILIEHFLNKFNKDYGKKVAISKEAFRKLIDYHWPGNVRELENTIERLVVMVDGNLILSEHLPLQVRVEDKAISQRESLTEDIEAIEKERISRALKESGYIQAKAARFLGITQRQLGYKAKKYGLTRK